MRVVSMRSTNFFSKKTFLLVEYLRNLVGLFKTILKISEEDTFHSDLSDIIFYQSLLHSSKTEQT